MILPAYQNLDDGITAAFFNAHLQGSMDQMEYVTNPDHFSKPLLQHLQIQNVKSKGANSFTKYIILLKIQMFNYSSLNETLVKV